MCLYVADRAVAHGSVRVVTQCRWYGHPRIGIDPRICSRDIWPGIAFRSSVCISFIGPHSPRHHCLRQSSAIGSLEVNDSLGLPWLVPVRHPDLHAFRVILYYLVSLATGCAYIVGSVELGVPAGPARDGSVSGFLFERGLD